jgi:hypothetical protein
LIPKPARTSSDLTLFRHCIISGSGLWERLAACTRCLLPWRPDTAKCPLGSAWSQCSIRQQSKALLTFGPPHRSVENDPMYGPAVRRKRISSFCRHCGLASMYPASAWSGLCSGPSWISACMRSHYRSGLERAIWVTSVRTHREDRSAISSHPLADLGGEM